MHLKMVYTQKKAEGGNMMEDDDTPANWGYPSIINFHTNIKSPQSGSRQLRLSPPNNDLPVQARENGSWPVSSRSVPQSKY